jgi:hypothetical protein
MKIKKLLADKHYKKSYMNIDGNVYKLESAVEHFASHKEAILKISKKLSPTKKLDLVFKTLPSETVILKKLIQKRAQILKDLGINSTNKHDPKSIQALALYLVNNIKYYDAVKEEVLFDYNTMYHTQLKKIIHKVNVAIDKVDEVTAQLQKNNSEELKQKKELYEAILQKQVDKFSIYNKVDKLKLEKAQDKYALQSTYKALIEKRGVCSDFSYAFNFLLNALEVKSEVLHIRYEANGKTNYHALNAIQGANQKYYYCDILEGFHANIMYQKNNKINNTLKKELLLKHLFFTKVDYPHLYQNATLRYYDHMEETPAFKVALLTGDKAREQFEQQVETTNDALPLEF